MTVPSTGQDDDFVADANVGERDIANEAVLLPVGNQRDSFRERVENGRRATAGQLFKSGAAREHQDDHRADEILAEQNGSDNGDAGKLV
ncbi:MAG: hypothetical protein ACREF8_07435 [Chthoniobacterales bacterium]